MNDKYIEDINGDSTLSTLTGSGFTGHYVINANVIHFKYKELEETTLTEFLDKNVFDEIGRIDKDIKKNEVIFLTKVNSLESHVISGYRETCTMVMNNKRQLTELINVKIEIVDSVVNNKHKKLKADTIKLLVLVYILGVVTSVTINYLI